MKKIIFIILFSHFFTLFSNPNPDQEKFVIGPWIAGFFSNFLSVLNRLAWCEKFNKKPVIYWDHTSSLYQSGGFNGSQNAWEYYFEPVSDLQYEQNDVINRDYWIPYHPFFLFTTIDAAHREHGNKIINKYIKIKRNIQEKIDLFYQENMQGKYTIGIHLRGTDKSLEQKVVSIDKIIDQANRCADENTQFFIATEDNKLFEIAKSHLKGKVIYYDAFRTNSSHYGWFQHVSNRAQLGQDVLIDCQLLSKCNKLIHIYSNVAAAALYFNPSLESILLKAE